MRFEFSGLRTRRISSSLKLCQTSQCRPITYDDLVESGPRASASVAHRRLMVASRSTDASFETKADAPASRNAWPASGSSIAVNMITFIAGFTRVISRHASSEWTFGRFTSSTITSGCESLRRLQQCAAVRDGSHDLAVQRQQPADGFHHVRVVVRKQHAGARGQHRPPFGTIDSRATRWWPSGCCRRRASRRTRRTRSVARAPG